VRPPQGGRTETSAPTLLGSCAVGVRGDPDYVVSCGCQVPDLTRTGELAAAKPTPGRILLAMTSKTYANLCNQALVYCLQNGSTFGDLFEDCIGTGCPHILLMTITCPQTIAFESCLTHTCRDWVRSAGPCAAPFIQPWCETLRCQRLYRQQPRQTIRQRSAIDRTIYTLPEPGRVPPPPRSPPD